MTCAHKLLTLPATLLLTVGVVACGDQVPVPISTADPAPGASGGLTSSKPEASPDSQATGADGSQAVPITDLKVGDCLSEVDDGDRAVYDVRVVDCGSAHSYEVFHKGEPRAYPAQDDWTETIGDLCTGPFEGYVGLPPDQSRYTVSAFTPQKSTWDNDLRTVTCIALPDDDTTTTGSAKNAKK